MNQTAVDNLYKAALANIKEIVEDPKGYGFNEETVRFAKSVSQFFSTRGYLTDKQMRALQRIVDSAYAQNENRDAEEAWGNWYDYR